jgi:hypothetical protein
LKLGENSYIRDRGYAFEQKLNANTKGVLNKKISDYFLPEQQGSYSCDVFQFSDHPGRKKAFGINTPCAFHDASTLRKPTT